MKLISTFFVHVLNWKFFQILLKGRRATERKKELKVWSEKITSHDIILVHHLARCIQLTASVAIVTVNLLSIILFIKKKTQSSHSCHVPSYKPDRNWGGFSHFSLFVTLFYLCDIVQFPHLTLELTLTTGFLFVWFPLTSLTNVAVISLDQMHATIRPYSTLKHRLIRKWVYGVTIAALVWVLPAMFIILILKNRMFNQIPIFSTSSGPSVRFMW